MIRALAPALKKAKTGTSAEGKPERQTPVEVAGRQAAFTVPAQSVTSFLVKGVSGVAKDAALLQKGHFCQLTGVQSGKALAVADDGTKLVIKAAGTDAPATEQQWRPARISGDTGNRQRYVFTNPAEGKRLAVRDSVPVLEGDSGRRDKATQWIMSTTGDGTWTLVSAATGGLLEVGGQATADGSAVTMWTPNSRSNQRWKISDVTDPTGS